LNFDATLLDRASGAAPLLELSGEIEQGIVAALYTSRSTKQPMSAALILHELRATQPLSVVMVEQVAALRAWAHDRTVPAD